MIFACNFVLCCIMYYQGHTTRQNLTFTTQLKKAIYSVLLSYCTQDSTFQFFSQGNGLNCCFAIVLSYTGMNSNNTDPIFTCRIFRLIRKSLKIFNINHRRIKSAKYLANYRVSFMRWDMTVQCKEVKNTLVYYLLIVLLIKRHVSAYSEAIIGFNKC